MKLPIYFTAKYNTINIVLKLLLKDPFETSQILPKILSRHHTHTLSELDNNNAYCVIPKIKIRKSVTFSRRQTSYPAPEIVKVYFTPAIFITPNSRLSVLRQKINPATVFFWALGRKLNLVFIGYHWIGRQKHIFPWFIYTYEKYMKRKIRPIGFDEILRERFLVRKINYPVLGTLKKINWNKYLFAINPIWNISENPNAKRYKWWVVQI